MNKNSRQCTLYFYNKVQLHVSAAIRSHHQVILKPIERKIYTK